MLPPDPTEARIEAEVQRRTAQVLEQAQLGQLNSEVAALGKVTKQMSLFKRQITRQINELGVAMANHTNIDHVELKESSRRLAIEVHDLHQAFGGFLQDFHVEALPMPDRALLPELIQDYSGRREAEKLFKEKQIERRQYEARRQTRVTFLAGVAAALASCVGTLIALAALIGTVHPFGWHF